TGMNLQMLAHAPESEDHFDAKSIHPACRARVPGPTAAPHIRLCTINIRSNYIRFNAIALHAFRRIAVINRVDQAEQVRGAVTLPHLGERPDRPQRSMGVL